MGSMLTPPTNVPSNRPLIAHRQGKGDQKRRRSRPTNTPPQKIHLRLTDSGCRCGHRHDGRYMASVSSAVASSAASSARRCSTVHRPPSQPHERRSTLRFVREHSAERIRRRTCSFVLRIGPSGMKTKAPVQTTINHIHRPTAQYTVVVHHLESASRKTDSCKALHILTFGEQKSRQPPCRPPERGQNPTFWVAVRHLQPLPKRNPFCSHTGGRTMSEYNRRDALRLMTAAGIVGTSGCRDVARSHPTPPSRPLPQSRQTVPAPLQRPLSPWDQSPPLPSSGLADGSFYSALSRDAYPAGNPTWDRKLTRWPKLGQDFSHQQGWSMYHGTTVPGFPRHPRSRV